MNCLFCNHPFIKPHGHDVKCYNCFASNFLSSSKLIDFADFYLHNETGKTVRFTLSNYRNDNIKAQIYFYGSKEIDLNHKPVINKDDVEQSVKDIVERCRKLMSYA